MSPVTPDDSSPPSFADALRWHAEGDRAAAGHAYEFLLAREPDNAAVLTKLGLLRMQNRQFADALTLLRRALAIDGALSEANLWLGETLRQQGAVEPAIAAFERALAAAPDLAPALFNLGLAERERRGHAAAKAAWLRFVALRPGDARVHGELGRLASERGDDAEAAEWFVRQHQRAPDDVQACIGAGLALERLARLDEAILWLTRAAALAPLRADIRNALGVAHFNLANHEEALAHYRAAIAQAPDFVEAHSNLLMALHYLEPADPAQLFAEHVAWARRLQDHALAGVGPRGRYANTRDPDRPLRIGYVSPRFCGGPLARFFLPLLEAHDRESFHVVCYATSAVGDAATEAMRQCASAWRDASLHSADALAALVRADAIDILVDLAGHCPGNSLETFARRAAPVQMTWMDYVDTTGVPAMDYLVSDPLHSPVAGAQRFTERVLRLPDTRLVYRPPNPLPALVPPPSLARGHVTFGCFNRLSKFGGGVVRTWAAILTRVPQARLVLKSTALASDATRNLVRRRFERHGVDPAVLDLRPFSGEFDMLLQYGDVDIALDPFPYNGCTTTCDALAMGVPVVTLEGAVMPGRHGVALLANCGLEEWVARSHEAYVDLACAAALDSGRLARLRRELRGRFLASPLTDAPRFARAFERLYRQAWSAWCADEAA